MTVVARYDSRDSGDGEYAYWCFEETGMSWWWVATSEVSTLGAEGLVGMRKELKNEGRLNCASVVLEFRRGLIASIRINRPV